MADEAFFRSYYEAYNSGEPARLSALLHDDVILISAQGEVKGKSAYLEMYRTMTTLFDDKMRPEKILVSSEGAKIDIHDRLRARQIIPDFLGRSFAPGDEMVLLLTGRYQLRDGLVHRIQIGPREP